MQTRMFESAAALGRRLWIATLLWVIGRTLCRAARVDEAVRQELAPLPDGLTIRLEVAGLTQALIIHKAAGNWQCGAQPHASGDLHPLRASPFALAAFVSGSIRRSAKTACWWRGT